MSTTVRNTALRVLAKDEPLDQDLVVEIIEFREMNSGSIQVVREGGDVNDGVFALSVSNLCDPSTFAPYPSGDISDCTSENLIWLFNHLPFKFAMITYTKGTDTIGTFSVYAQGKK